MFRLFGAKLLLIYTIYEPSILRSRLDQRQESFREVKHPGEGNVQYKRLWSLQWRNRLCTVPTKVASGPSSQMHNNLL